MKYPLQGLSLADTLINGTSLEREYCVSENFVQKTLITNDYKYSKWIDDNEEFVDLLFDRNNDEFEIHNLIDDKNYADIKNDLIDKLKEWESKVSDEGKRTAYKKGEKIIYL